MSEIKPVAYFRATKKRGIIWSEDCCCADPVFDDAYDDGYDGEDDETFSLPVYSAAAYEALENERDKLKQNLEDLQERFNGIKFIESELRKDNDSLSTEVFRLKNELIASLKDWHELNTNHEAQRNEAEILQKENADLKATISNLTKAYERESNDCLKALEERDYWYEKTDSLADKISEVFDVPVGEHSNVNCPFDEANKILDGEYVTKFDKESAALKAENEELRNLVKDKSTYCPKCKGFNSFGCQICFGFGKILNQISILDGLPKPNKPVLVFVDRHNFGENYFDISYLESNGEWQIKNGFNQHVSHWWALPPAPISKNGDSK